MYQLIVSVNSLSEAKTLDKIIHLVNKDAKIVSEKVNKSSVINKTKTNKLSQGKNALQKELDLALKSPLLKYKSIEELINKGIIEPMQLDKHGISI